MASVVWAQPGRSSCKLDIKEHPPCQAGQGAKVASGLLRGSMETPECVLSPTTNCPLQALTITLSLSPSNPAGGSVSSVALLLKLSLSGTADEAKLKLFRGIFESQITSQPLLP